MGFSKWMILSLCQIYGIKILPFIHGSSVTVIRNLDNDSSIFQMNGSLTIGTTFAG